MPMWKRRFFSLAGVVDLARRAQGIFIWVRIFTLGRHQCWLLLIPDSEIDRSVDATAAEVPESIPDAIRRKTRRSFLASDDPRKLNPILEVLRQSGS